MPRSPWESALDQIVSALNSWLPSESVSAIRRTEHISSPLDDGQDVGHGVFVKAGQREFHVQWKSSSTTVAIRHAIYFLRNEQEDRIPVVAVPFMGPTGQEICKAEGINWMDLSGNAFISDPRSKLLIDKSGNPNKFIKRGRPSSVFAPKSSRVIHWLLLNPNKAFTNKRLVHETGADAGHISRILKHLEAEGYISRKVKGEQRLLKPELLLADWRDDYDFFKQNEVIRGHVPVRPDEDLSMKIAVNIHLATTQNKVTMADVFPNLRYLLPKDSSIAQPRYAFTGLSSAWRYTSFVSHRLVSVYVMDTPIDQLQKSLGFQKETREQMFGSWFRKMRVCLWERIP